MKEQVAKLLLLALGLSSFLITTTDGAKVKRVKAGKIYQEHDAVHIVVNKVG
jgi:hypothetical protein